MPACTWRLQTPPPSGSSAIAVIALAGDIDRALSAIPIRPVAPGAIALRSLAGIDRGIVARFSESSAYVMPHASPAVLRALLAALSRARLAELAAPDPRTQFPEARSLIEARMLAAVARAASPLAIDLLLDQPRRWALAAPGADGDDEVLAHSRVLNRLIDPPLVVALGRPNIGKSSLLNALAGRRVALVADEPGTTRDHVGVTLDLAGLVVRYIDSPGIQIPSDRERSGRETATGSIDAEAASIALQSASAADLLLLCADPTAPFLDPPAPDVPVLRVGLRADLAGAPAVEEDLHVSIRQPATIEKLVTRLRDALVPPSDRENQRPWRFW